MLSGDYSYYTGKLEEILQTKTDWWNEHRKNVQSDKACDRAWDATKEGKEELHLRSLLKRIDTMIKALSSYIRVQENMARNIY